MGARGRKSAADLSVVLVQPDSRPAAPDGLTAAEAARWDSIVASLPADWIRSSDIPLLAAYCQAAAQNAKATEELGSASLTLTTETGKVYANPLVMIQHQTALRMAALAVKLRLCPSSRYRADHAASKIGKPSTNSKPWQYGLAK